MNTDRRLDWVSRHDPRSRRFPVTAVAPRARRRRMWRTSFTRIDQGSEGACVGFAWTNELRAAPVHVPISARTANEFARSIYLDAQRIDEWPGEAYEGTSVLAGAKVCQQRGLIGSYHWAFGIEQVIDAVVSLGPVIVGIPWLSGMYDTRPDGLVTVSGNLVGGHAICITGYDPARRFHDGTREVLRWRNSWGDTYGVRGDGWITKSELAVLLDSTYGAEACVPTNRSIPT